MNFTARLKLQVEAQHHYFVARVLVRPSRSVETDLSHHTADDSSIIKIPVCTQGELTSAVQLRRMLASFASTVLTVGFRAAAMT
jgi:hypothetical protein